MMLSSKKTPISQQRKYDLINSIKAAILVLAGESTMENQAKLFGKYMPNAPVSGNPENTYEFQNDDLFNVIFKRDKKLAWNTISILLIDKNRLTSFNEKYFAEMLQLDFERFAENNETTPYNTYSYKWQLNENIKVIFKVDADLHTEDKGYPKHFYQTIVFRG